MYQEVLGQRAYAYTGGKAFSADKPTVVFIHGVLNDHSVWILQTRYLAHHGWNVLAVDLPGHGRSAGSAPASVAEASDFVLAFLDRMGVAKAALVGHSFGSLIALHTAAAAPERVTHLALVGCAFPMRVSPALLQDSLAEPERAIALVNVLSHSTMAPPPSALGPGTWLHGGSRALMRRTLRTWDGDNNFHVGFKACDSYDGGLQAMAAVQCPTLFVLGYQDQMTPPKAAEALVAQAKNSSVARLSAGHQMMTEAPDACLMALTVFLKAG